MKSLQAWKRFCMPEEMANAVRTRFRALSISLAAASDSLHVLSVRHVEVERVSLLILQIEAHFEEVTVILRVLILFASFLAR